MKRSVWVGFAAATYVLGLGSAAHAVPIEELVQLAIDPRDSNILALRYEYGGEGFLLSRDGGQSFELVCGSSVKTPDGAPMNRLGPIAIAGDGKLLIGVFDGLFEDDTTACAWSRASVLQDQWISDITLSPADPDVTYAITSRGGDVPNGLVKRDGSGTWSEVGEKKAMLLSRLVIAKLPSDGLRFYVSGVSGMTEPDIDAGIPPQPLYALRMSENEGQSWTELPIGEVDGTLRLEGVDPSNPNRLVFSILRDRDPMTNVALDDSVMVSDDGGASLREWLTVTKFGGVTFGPDGDVWVGDAGDTMAPSAAQGVWHAASLDDEPEKLSGDYPVRCLDKRGDTLYACQRFEFGTIDPASGEFTSTLKLGELQTMKSCDGFDMAATCRMQLCTAYCGVGHFAQAPMCTAAYDSNLERGCGGPLPAGTGGGSGTGGSGGSSADAGVAGHDGGHASPDAGEPSGGGGSGDGGCSVARVGAGSRDHSLLFALIAAVASVRLVTQRRRKRG